MSKLDDWCGDIHEILDGDNEDMRRLVVRQFFERTDYRGWYLEDATIKGKLTFKRYKDGSYVSGYVEVDIGDRVRSTWGNSYADVCEGTGLPFTYLEGVQDVVRAIRDGGEYPAMLAQREARLCHLNGSITEAKWRLEQELIKHRALTKPSQIEEVSVSYPDAPKATVTINGCFDEIPCGSGVYIAWDGDGRVAYVGQSTSIKRRLSGHDKVFTGDRVGFVLCDKDELLFTEAYYIGTLRPYRNFGWDRREKGESDDE